MELVYLWVEEYKNIHKQGFNFSPRFNCNYDPDTNELTIDENDDYIENFFGDNINVTAIVGKNGSGKSSIVELLEHIDSYECELYLTKRMPFLILFHQNGEKKGFTNIKKISEINSLFEFVNNPHDSPPTHEDMLSMRTISEHECTFSKLISFLTLNSEMPYPHSEDRKLRILRKKTIDYSQYNIADLAIKNAKDNFTFELTTFMLYPKEIILFQNESLTSHYLDKIFKVDFMNDISSCVRELQSYLVEYNIQQGKTYKLSSLLEAYMVYRIIENGQCSKLLKSYQEGKRKSIQVIYTGLDSGVEYSQDEFNELINKWYELNKLEEKEIKLFNKYEKFIKFDFKDIKGRSFSNLSHGEKSIYAQFISIYDMAQKNNNNLIVLDEPDLSLHPVWQKKYLNEIYGLLTQFNNNIHLIFTTHSPFLLSDIPKQNIIFLDTYKEDDKEVVEGKQKVGNCKVVDGLNEKKETFGANIHTLLSDSFFMEDGLMGEFAKGKINEIIDFHKQVEDENKREDSNLDTLKTEYNDKKKRFWDVQSIIGEEYLKQIIKNHLVEIEKILLGKDEAKQQEIKRTETYLKSLKND